MDEPQFCTPIRTLYSTFYAKNNLHLRENLTTCKNENTSPKKESHNKGSQKETITKKPKGFGLRISLTEILW